MDKQQPYPYLFFCLDKCKVVCYSDDRISTRSWSEKAGRSGYFLLMLFSFIHHISANC
jgi:hypothetical protein